MKRRVSLSKITVMVQVVLFMIVLGLAVLIGVYFQRHTVEEETAAREAELAARIRDVESRLNADALQVREMLHSVLDNDELWSEDQGRKYFSKITVKNRMKDKALLYPDLETMFACRKGDFYLGISSEQQTGEERLAYRDYMMAPELLSNSNRSLWKIRDVDGVSYCLLVYGYPKEDIYVGIGLLCDDIFSDVNTFFEITQGHVAVRDSDGLTYTYPAFETPGDIKIEGASSGTELKFEGYITVEMLEFLKQSTFASVLMLVLVSVGSIVAQHLILGRAVVRPVTELSQAVKNAADKGGNIEHLEITVDAETEEIYTLQTVLDYLLHEVLSARLQLYKHKVEKQDMELKQLRSQLRPHFYLNAIMTVNSMTYQNRNEDIREYLAGFSDHMRYMMRITTGMVVLKEELSHIENYVTMQKIKFPSSVILMTECPERLENAKIPHLLLYTVVENSFKYAMTLQETMVLTITCEEVVREGFSGYQVTLEDNGKGFEEQILALYNGGQLSEDMPEDKEEKHIGLNNVKQSLFLQYGRRDLLRLSNALPHGARVEIRIPAEF